MRIVSSAAPWTSSSATPGPSFRCKLNQTCLSSLDMCVVDDGIVCVGMSSMDGKVNKDAGIYHGAWARQ